MAEEKTDRVFGCGPNGIGSNPVPTSSNYQREAMQDPAFDALRSWKGRMPITDRDSQVFREGFAIGRSAGKHGQCGDNSKPALTRSDCQKAGNWCPTLEREASRMYDEGFNEATVLMLRGGDLLAEAYRRLKSTHGKELGAEIAGAMHARKAAQQTQAAPSPDYGTAEVPFGSFVANDTARLRADRAALVAQLEAAERSHREALNIEAAEVSRWKDLAHDANAARVALDGRVRELAAQVAELTRERDEARSALQLRGKLVNSLNAAVTRLARERDEARAELRDAVRDAATFARDATAAESEVTRLTEALAAAERPNGWRKDCEAAEAKIAAALAHYESQPHRCDSMCIMAGKLR